MSKLNFDYGDGHPELAFNNRNEAIDFMQLELGRWNFLTKLQHASNSQAQQQITNTQTDLDNIRRKINNIARIDPDANTENKDADLQTQSALNTLTSLYKNNKILPPSNPHREFVLALSKENAAVATSAMYTCITGGATSPESQLHLGYSLALANNINSELNLGKIITRELIDEFNSKTFDLESRSNNTLQVLNDSHNRAKKMFIKLMRDASRNKKSAKLESKKLLDDANTKIEKAKENLDAMIQSYKDHMKLKAPVSYWKKKRTWHVSLAILLALTLSVTGWLGGTMIWNLTNKTASSVVASEANLGESPSPSIELQGPQTQSPPQPSPQVIVTQDIPIWRLSLIGFIALLYIWLLRIIAKLFFSQIHLATDASERIVLIMSYLAMVADPDAKMESGLETVIQSVFRNSSSGIIREDGMPNTPLTELSRLLSGRNS